MIFNDEVKRNGEVRRSEIVCYILILFNFVQLDNVVVVVTFI